MVVCPDINFEINLILALIPSRSQQFREYKMVERHDLHILNLAQPPFELHLQQTNLLDLDIQV